MDTQEFFGLNWDPSEFHVDDGEITSKVRDSENGFHLVAEHKGVRLWAEILDGKEIDYRAFDEHGREVAVVTFIVPDARLDRPTENELRQLRPDETSAPNPPPDGGAGNPPPDGGAGGDGGDGGYGGDGGVPIPIPIPVPVPVPGCHTVCVVGYDGIKHCYVRC